MSLASSSVNRSGTVFRAKSPAPAMFTTQAVLAMEASPNLNQFTYPDTFQKEDSTALLEVGDTIHLSVEEPASGRFASVPQLPVHETFQPHIRLTPNDVNDATDLILLQVASNWAISQNPLSLRD
jgi:hypothetical protein